MYVNIEFLGTEPIENVITSLHFKMDKTIFFGYHEVIKEYQDQTSNFLKRYCGVKEVALLATSRTNLSKVLESMQTVIGEELEQGNEIFFDVTGGESLILVAFGMLAKEYNVPMHLYDIEKDQLLELNPQCTKSIRKSAREQSIKLNLNQYIEMHGGKINDTLDKKIVDVEDEEFMSCVRKLWQVMLNHKKYWNPFSDVLKSQFAPNESLFASADRGSIRAALEKLKDFRELSMFEKLISEVAKTGALTGLKIGNGQCSFYYKSRAVKECLWKGGTLLELYMYDEMKKSGEFDCDESVHIDWDGHINTAYGKDVLNEIDVLSIKGNIPTFISCKSGRMDDGQALHALYELETVARRFGGKYARKILATLQPVKEIYVERAKEMNISIKSLNER